MREIDLHLVLCCDLKLIEAHIVCDHIEEDLRRRILGVHVIIHVEPCETKSPEGLENCRREQNKLFWYILNNKPGAVESRD